MSELPGKPNTPAADVVPHPRFGSRSVPSGIKAPQPLVLSPSLGDFRTDVIVFPDPAIANEDPRPLVLRSSWGSFVTEVTVFPDSAIPADASRQNYTACPRSWYMDIRRPCRACGRPFIFFAREQRYWYEVLGFYISADCVHCVECRRKNQQLRRRFQRYSERIGGNDLSDPEFATLIEDAVFLYHEGVLRNEQRLRTLKNQAVARLPGEQATEAILGVIAEIQSRKQSAT